MAYTTKEEQLAALRAPFPPEVIKRRDLAGVTLVYVEWTTVQERLAEVFPGQYNLDCGQVFNTPLRVAMEVILTVTYVDGTQQRVTGWGSSDKLYAKGRKLGNNWVLYPDDYPYELRAMSNDAEKGAFSDGFKVVCSKLGLALDLYIKEKRAELYETEPEHEAPKPRKQRSASAPEPEAVSEATDTPEAPKAGSGLSRFKTKKAAINE